MPVVTFDPNVQSSFFDLHDYIEILAFSAEITSHSSSTVTSVSGNTVYTISGSDFSYAVDEDGTILVSGNTDSILIEEAEAPVISFTDMDLDVEIFGDAVFAELTLTDITALEDLLLSLDWEYHGNDNADILLKSSVSSDGVPMNLMGSDLVYLNGGKDRLFIGDGKDTVYGGAGNDKIWGGSGRDNLSGDGGNDKLWGEAGNDTVFGNGGHDTLFGGNNNDKLYGGNGNDILNGGRGNDILTGGNGTDDFVFSNAFGSDVITDFDATNNKEDIDLSAVSAITGFNDLSNNHLSQVGSDAVITVGSNSITLEGVNIADLNAADFIF